MQALKLIGVCLSTVHEEDRFNFVKEFNRYAVENGFRVLVFNSCADLYEQNTAVNEGASSVFKLIPYDRLSALVIFPNIMYDNGIVDVVVNSCVQRGIPVISVDRDMENCITFTFDNGGTFEKLCRHVIEDHGARNVYMMAGFKDNVYSEERISAFRRALERSGIPFEPDNIGYGCFWEVPTIEVLDRWFVKEKREVPDAIICANDFMAITVSSYLQEKGVRIPDDCIITGFDGIRQAEYLPPNMTTCKQDFARMCKMMISVIERIGAGEEISGRFVLDFNIVYSQSCGCAKLNYDKVSNSIRSLFDSLRYSDERQKMTCNTQASIPRIAHVNELPRTLVDKFHLDTCVFALNEGVFSPPDFGRDYKGENCYSSKLNIIYHRYGKKEYEQCVIPMERLLPRYDLLVETPRPIIICCSNFADMVMGFCVFQPRIDIDEYEKIHNFMNVTGAALGSFHTRMQIKSMNDKLIAANNELERMSRHDYMTGLFNRRGFFDKLDRSLDDKKDSSSTLVLISIDLDGLKYINDTFGHAEGDNAIMTVGRALLNCAWQDEICARFGGDEFCVAVIITEPDAGTFFAEFQRRFEKFLNEYNSKSGKEYDVMASIGYHSELIRGGVNTEEVIKRADEKMYNFKIEHKRNRKKS